MCCLQVSKLAALAAQPTQHAPVRAVWSPAAKGLVCPMKEAQHLAQSRWHLPFIGCKGSRVQGTGLTLLWGRFWRGGAQGLEWVGGEGWCGGGAQLAACPGGGVTVPALPSHLSPWLHEPSTGPEGPNPASAHPSQCSEAGTAAAMVSRPCCTSAAAGEGRVPVPLLPLPPAAVALDLQPHRQQLEGWHCPSDAQGPLRRGQVNQRGTSGDGDLRSPGQMRLGKGWGRG